MKHKTKNLDLVLDAINTAAGKTTAIDADEMLALENIDGVWSDTNAGATVDAGANAITTIMTNANIFNEKMSPDENRSLAVAIENASSVMASSFHPVKYLHGHDDGIAIENFDDQHQQASKSASTYYNALSGVPDGISNAIYSTFTPVSAGIKSRIEVRWEKLSLTVADYHSDGTPVNYKDRSFTDVLHNGLSDAGLRLLPVRGTAAAELLVDPTDVPVRTTPRDDEILELSPILFGVDVNYIGLDQSPGTTVHGQADRSETIGHNPKLAAIYVRFGDDVIRFNTLGDRSSIYGDNHNGSVNKLKLHYNGSLRLDFNSKDILSNDLVTLADIAAQNYTVTMATHVSGSVDNQTGDGRVNYNGMTVIEILDDTGVEIAKTDAAVEPLVALLEAGEGVGYTPKMLATNSNLSHNPTILNTEPMKFPYGVSVKNPVGIKYPVNRQASAKVLNRLINLAKFDKAYNVIKTLEETCVIINEHTNGVNTGKVPGMFGMGGDEVSATFIPAEIDLSQDLNSISHAMRRRDVQSMIYETLVETGTQLWVDSGLGSAKAMIYEGLDVRPVLNVLCDERIAGSLRKINDNRMSNENTGTELFDLNITSLPSDALIGTAYLTFSFNTPIDADVGLLDFGYCVEGVSPVFNANMTVGRGTFTALQVHPIWDLHVVTPVIGKVTITGWLEAMGKVPTT